MNKLRQAAEMAWKAEQKANPHTAYNSWCRGYEAGLRQALDQLPDDTKMIEPSMGLIASEWVGLEEPPNSTTDVVEPETDVRLLKKPKERVTISDKQRQEWVKDPRDMCGNE